jgi:outer membrane protein assembly factor BamE (lipoprotein component of BamABCDE complex)
MDLGGQGRWWRPAVAAGTGRAGALVLALALAGALGACAPTYTLHGYAPPDSELTQIEVGRDDRAAVEAAFGRPGVAGLLTEDVWYYVQSRHRHSGLRAPAEIERQVLAISFDGQGRVANIERFGLEQGRVVALSRRVTDPTVRGVGLLRQLLRNLGRFDPGQFIPAG